MNALGALVWQAPTNQVDTPFVNEERRHFGGIGGFGGQMSSHLEGKHIGGIWGIGWHVETQCALEYVLDT